MYEYDIWNANGLFEFTETEKENRECLFSAWIRETLSFNLLEFIKEGNGLTIVDKGSLQPSIGFFLV